MPLATGAELGRQRGMIVRWTVAGVELAGIFDVELARWKWGGRRWSWPWQRVERDAAVSPPPSSTSVAA